MYQISFMGMALTNIISDWMSNASSGLCILLYIILHGSFKLHLGGLHVIMYCNNVRTVLYSLLVWCQSGHCVSTLVK